MENRKLSVKLNGKAIVYSFFALICVACFIFFHIIPNRKLEKEHRYTLARVIGFEMPVEGGEMAKIEFFVNNKRYTSSFTIDAYGNKKYKKGDRIYLEFYPQDPSIGHLIFDKIVNDTTEYIPIDGWSRIP